MKKLLVVVDMQNDFIDGVLGTPEAQALVPSAAEYIRAFDGDVVYTQDTHDEHYLDTEEGRRIPVPHCLKGSHGWEIRQEVAEAGAGKTVATIEKDHFASVDLPGFIRERGYEDIRILGLCTDLCVVSNAFCIRGALPDARVGVVKHCCAGVSPESHENALSVMRMCMIDILD